MKQYFLILACIFFYTLEGSNPTVFDTSFNGVGYVEQSLGATQTAGQNSVLMQADGKIISIGVTSDTTPISILLTRYLPNGTVDTNYGTNGITTQSFGFNTYGYAATIQTDGKVVVAGSLHNPTPSRLFIARFTTAGILDSSFGSGAGYITAQVGEQYSTPTAIAIQPMTGTIFIGGYLANSSGTDPQNRLYFIASYLSDGTINGTFNGGSITTATPPSFNAVSSGSQMIVQSDGKVVIVGACYITASNNWLLAIFRYTSSGVLDTSTSNNIPFTPNGYVIFPNTIYPYSFGQGIALQSNGSIIVSGSATTTSGNRQIMTARYLTDGTIDTSFNGTGYNVTTIPNSSLSIGIQSLLEPSGKIIAGGYATFANSFNNILLVRYNSNGTLDTSLNSNGYMLSDINGQSTTLRSNTIQANGKIVIVAQTTTDNDSMITIRYLGGNILEGSTQQIDAYGYNSNFISEFLYVDFYATIITDPTAQAATILAINTILADYATDYANQPNFNYLLYLYLLEEQFIEAQLDLITEYGDVGISQFFIYLNDRITKLSNPV